MNEEVKKAIIAALDGWEVSRVWDDSISFYKDTEDAAGVIKTEHLFIYEKLSLDDSKPKKYAVKFGSWERFRFSVNFYNKRDYTVQRSGDLKKTLARLAVIA